MTAPRDEAARWWGCFTLLAVLVVVCFRRPDQALFPSFSYEAGTLFFVENRVFGWHALFMAPAGQVGGYLVLLPRLIAFLGGFVDLRLVPTFYNICACACLLGVAAMCFYARIESSLRYLLALGLVLVPHGGEVFLDINLLHFACAPVLALLILQRDATRWWQWVIDLSALVLMGLTGPFLVLLVAPLIILRFYRFGRTRYNVTLAAVALLLAGIQLGCLWHFGRLTADFQQATVPPGQFIEAPWPVLLLRVISEVFAGGFLMGRVYPLVVPSLAWVVAPVFFGLLVLIARCVTRKVRFEVTVLLLLAALMYAVQLYRSRTFLAHDHPFYAGQRYFYLPYVFLCWALVVACEDPGWVRALAVGCLGLMLLSATSQFSRRLLPDTEWEHYAHLVQEGHEVVIPINPPGWAILVGPHDRGRILAPNHNTGYHFADEPPSGPTEIRGGILTHTPDGDVVEDP